MTEFLLTKTVRFTIRKHWACGLQILEYYIEQSVKNVHHFFLINLQKLVAEGYKEM